MRSRKDSGVCWITANRSMLQWSRDDEVAESEYPIEDLTAALIEASMEPRR